MRLAAGRLYKDGRLIIPAAATAVADRRKLSFAGVISIAITLDPKGEIVDGPEFEMVGIPERNAEGGMFENIIAEAIIDALDGLPRARRRDPGSVAEAIRRAVRTTVAQQWGKKPLCLVHVLTG